MEMDKSKFITKIKEMFSNDVKETFEEDETKVSGDTKQDFLDITTDEGVMIRINGEVEVGDTVDVIDEEGNVIEPAPDGEHTVEGIKVVTEGGIITEITPMENEEPVEDEVVVEEPMAEVEVAFATEEFVNGLISRIEEMENKFNELTDKFSKFSKEPVNVSTKTENKFSDTSKKVFTKEDKIKFFSKRNK